MTLRQTSQKRTTDSAPTTQAGAQDTPSSPSARQPGFSVRGRFLYDGAGEKVILYGVNKMAIWQDRDGSLTFAEIAKTGANVIRIVWTSEGTAAELDAVIVSCRAEHMIPLIELHDATGDWSKLPLLVDYWTRADIVAVLDRHAEYLLINIGNEVGVHVDDDEFRAGYGAAIARMRAAGIDVPLIVDGADWGKDLGSLIRNGPALIEQDPQHNLIFSIHMWWPGLWYPDPTHKVVEGLQQAVDMELPLIVGEFGHQWDETSAGAIPYRTILEQCHRHEVGYLAWEWGPGNSPQTFLDMTADGTYASLRGWGLEVAVTDPHSIQRLAVRPASLAKTPVH